MVVGSKIRARREELGMTMEELGRLLGVNKATIMRYEKQQIESMPYITFFKLLIALQTTPEYLLPPEEYELIEKSDELRGFYLAVSQTKPEIMNMMRALPPEDSSLGVALARGLLGRHKE